MRTLLSTLPSASSVAVSLAFWAVFGVTAPIVLVLSVLLWLIGMSVDPDRAWVHGLICRYCAGLLQLNPCWKVEILGREKIPAGPCVLVANHQSMADIPVVMGLRVPFKFVSKSSLFKIPLVGWAMRMAGYVPLERGRAASARLMLERCRKWLTRGVPVLIFPEGTYSTTGLLPFRRGAFRLAIEQKVPLVPVRIEGTPSLVVEDGPWLSPRCRIRIEVLPAIPAEALGKDEAALAERVRSLY